MACAGPGLLFIAVFCAADDLLPKRAENAGRIVTDAEVVTLCVAQSMMGIPSDPRFLAAARKRLAHLFPKLPDRAGFYKRREGLSDTIEALIAEFAGHSPGSYDDVLLVAPRSSALAPARRSSAAGTALWPTRSAMPPTTATAPATAATSTASGCTRCSRWTAPPEHSR
jgi:hypothetical protein